MAAKRQSSRNSKLGREKSEGPVWGMRQAELETLIAEGEALTRRFAGKWIVLEGNRVLFAAASEEDADALAREAGISAPFVVFVPAKPDLPFIG